MDPYAPLHGPTPPLPDFATSFRTPFLSYSLLSPDGTRQVTPGYLYSLALTNPTLPSRPSINLVFFPAADGKPFHVDLNWMRVMHTAGGYACWDGSPGVQRLVPWHRRYKPDPSYAELRHQHRPDILDHYLDAPFP
jgi:hypothetical protein